MKNIEPMPVSIIQPVVIKVRPSKAAQNRAECGSDGEMVQTYRNGCASGLSENLGDVA